jgi:hypothetical protein
MKKNFKVFNSCVSRKEQDQETKEWKVVSSTYSLKVKLSDLISLRSGISSELQACDPREVSQDARNIDGSSTSGPRAVVPTFPCPPPSGSHSPVLHDILLDIDNDDQGVCSDLARLSISYLLPEYYSL